MKPHRNSIPLVFVLGGQPEQVNHLWIELAKRETKDNIMIINGDDFSIFYTHDFNLYLPKIMGMILLPIQRNFPAKRSNVAIERER